MNALLLTQILVYDLIDVTFCVLVVLAPFREYLCSRKRLYALALILYALVAVSRISEQTGLLSISTVSVMRIVLYVLLISMAVRSTHPKRFFVLIVMLNYTSFMMILFYFMASSLFSFEFEVNPYSFRSSFLLAVVFTICFPPIYLLMVKKIRPLMNSAENNKMWSYIWLAPATFCIIFHYSVLVNHGGIAFSSQWYNVVFSAVINAGSLLVTSMIVMLVNESNANLELKTENYQLAMQTLQYESLKNRMEETRLARHDLRHNMMLVKSYLDDESYEELNQYIRQYMSALSLDSPIIYCDNYALNTVLAYYGGIADAHGFEYKAEVVYPRPASLSDMDVTVMLGNLLENAVEACSRQTEGHRFIRIWFKQEKTAIIIAVDNSYGGIIKACNGGFISSKNGYTGTGVSSIKKIAEKYHGVAKFEYDGGVFSASVMLNP